MIKAGKHIVGEFNSSEEGWFDVTFENIKIDGCVHINEGPLEACGWGTDGGIDHYEPAWVESIIEIEGVVDSEGDPIEDYDHDEIEELLYSIQ
jgi:hypothetical protein